MAVSLVVSQLFAVPRVHAEGQAAIPVVTANAVAFGTKTIKLKKGKDKAIVVSSWKRVVLMQARGVGTLVSIYNFSGKKLFKDRLVLGRCLILESKNRIVYGFNNNEFQPEDTLITDLNDRVVAKIFIQDPIEDWHQTPDCELIWTMSSSPNGRYLWDCRFFDLNGKCVLTKTARSNQPFQITYQGKTYDLKFQVEEM